MIDEQPNIEFWARELRNGQLIKSFAQRRSSDLNSIDQIRLAALTS